VGAAGRTRTEPDHAARFRRATRFRSLCRGPRPVSWPASACACTRSWWSWSGVSTLLFTHPNQASDGSCSLAAGDGGGLGLHHSSSTRGARSGRRRASRNGMIAGWSVRFPGLGVDSAVGGWVQIGRQNPWRRLLQRPGRSATARGNPRVTVLATTPGAAGAEACGGAGAGLVERGVAYGPLCCCCSLTAGLWSGVRAEQELRAVRSAGSFRHLDGARWRGFFFGPCGVFFFFFFSSRSGRRTASGPNSATQLEREPIDPPCLRFSRRHSHRRGQPPGRAPPFRYKVRRQRHRRRTGSNRHDHGDSFGT